MFGIAKALGEKLLGVGPSVELHHQRHRESTTPHAPPTMSLIHKSIGSRLIATSARRSARPFTTRSRLHADEPTPKASAADPPAGKDGESSLIRKEGPSEGTAHAPDYNVAVDYRTSTFSPIPRRVMNGSEPGESVAAAVLSGAPVDLQARTVRYIPIFIFL